MRVLAALGLAVKTFLGNDHWLCSRTEYGTGCCEVVSLVAVRFFWRNPTLRPPAASLHVFGWSRRHINTPAWSDFPPPKVPTGAVGCSGRQAMG